MSSSGGLSADANLRSLSAFGLVAVLFSIARRRRLA
jgi:hypothetical protein